MLELAHETTFIIPGVPVAKARPRIVTFTRKDGTPGARVFTPKKTINFENKVAFGFVLPCPEFTPWDGPVQMTITAFFPIPAGKPKWWKKAAENQCIPHTVRPDGDNILKAIKDGLACVAYTNDTRVYMAIISKWYSTTPCTVVRLAFQEEPMKPKTAKQREAAMLQRGGLYDKNEAANDDG